LLKGAEKAAARKKTQMQVQGTTPQRPARRAALLLLLCRFLL